MVDISLLANPIYLAQNVVDGLARGAVYAVFALGFTLIFGVLDILNLAHASTYMWCAFVGWIAMSQVGLPLWAGLMAPMISSIGASIIMVSLAEAAFTVQTKRFPTGVLNPTPILLGGTDGVRVSWAQLLIVAVSVLLMIALGYLIRSTRTGKAMRAVAYSQRAAQLLGIDINRVVLTTFWIGGMLAGAAGVLVGLLTSSIAPSIGSQIELRGLAVVILGGLGNIEGAVLGGFVLGLVETFTIAYLQQGGDYKDAVAFLILFLMLLVRPNGLLGRREANRA